MLLAGFVVAQEFALEHVFEEFGSDDARTFFTGLRSADGKLERVVAGAGVAIRKGRDAEEDIVRRFRSFVAQAAVFVRRSEERRVGKECRSRWSTADG